MQFTKPARSFFLVLSGVVGLAGLVFVFPYLPALAFAALLSLLFHPLYERITARVGGRSWLGVALTLLVMALTLIVPLAIAGAVVSQVIANVAGQFSATSLIGTVSVGSLVAALNAKLALVPGLREYSLDAASITSQLQSMLGQLGTVAVQGVRGIGGLLAGFIPNFFIGIYAVAAILPNYERIRAFIHRISPLSHELDTLYLHRIRVMAISMVRGTFIIALLQAGFTTLFLWIGGVPGAAFLGLISFVASIVPLGAGIISIPTGIILLATGHVWQGLLQLAGNFVLVSNIDNLLRPRLVDKDASLHPALVLTGLFAGIYHFGFLGAVYGPIVMIVLVTTVEILLMLVRPDAAGE